MLFPHKKVASQGSHRKPSLTSAVVWKESPSFLLQALEMSADLPFPHGFRRGSLSCLFQARAFQDILGSLSSFTNFKPSNGASSSCEVASIIPKEDKMTFSCHYPELEHVCSLFCHASGHLQAPEIKCLWEPWFSLPFPPQHLIHE